MAAPSIPNLNSLRGGRGGGGGGLRRGYGRSRPDATETQEDVQETRDKIIRQTDGDASSSRLSAVALGYLDDAFARSFVEGQIPRRYPLINRGTYVRTSAIDRLVDTFLDSLIPANDQDTSFPTAPAAQIISLGAGSDTRFFRLPLSQRRALVYHELDFQDNTTAKVNAIQRDPHLKTRILDSLATPSALTITSNTTIHSPTYNLHALDLRLFATSSPPQIPNLRTDIPTLLLSECCLCYLPPTITSTILSHFTTTLLPLVPISLILYEPIRPYDSFGKTMISNLGSRGIELQTLKKYYSLDAQRLRLKQAGFTGGQGARDVEQIYYECVEVKERERVERLEWLDEVEEWKLLARHYCVAWGWRDTEKRKVFGEAWKGVRGERTEDEWRDDEVM